MKETYKILVKNSMLNRFKENSIYNENLNAITIFPYSNVYKKVKFYKIILNFSFKSINFKKKKVLPFFLAMELLVNQKCIVTLSSKNVLVWKLRKKMLVGCKLTLRKEMIEDFFDNIVLALPRMDKIQPLNLFKNKKLLSNSISFSLLELYFFYTIELGLGLNTQVKTLDINLILNSFTQEEKFFILSQKKIPLLVK